MRYETFSARPVESAEAICSFIGAHVLPPMEAVLRGLRFDGDTGAPPPGLVATTLPAADAAFLERYAGHALTRFGYPPADTALRGRDRLAFRLATWPLNRLSMAAGRALGAGAATAAGW